MGVFIRIAKVLFSLGKIITPTLSKHLTVLNELQQPAELRKSHCSHLQWGKRDLNALFKFHLDGQTTDSFIGNSFIFEELYFTVHFQLFSCKGSSGEGGDGAPIRDGKHLQLCKTEREKKPIYSRTALILPSHRESRSRLQGEPSLLLAHQEQENNQKLHQWGRVSSSLHPKDLSSSELANIHTSEIQGLVTYIIAFQFKHFELQRDPVLGWSYHLPDAVFVSRIFLGPSRASNGPIELGDEAPTGSWRGNKWTQVLLGSVQTHRLGHTVSYEINQILVGGTFQIPASRTGLKCWELQRRQKTSPAKNHQGNTHSWAMVLRGT